MCRTSKGCPIKEHLKYSAIVAAVEAFLNKKLLENYKGYDSLISELVISGGLNDVTFALKLESVFSSWLDFKRKQKGKK